MSTRRKALWDSLKALYVADTSSGGLRESDGDNALFEFLLEKFTTRSRNTPSVYVEIDALDSKSLTTAADRLLVRLHLFTDVHADSEMDPQDGIAEQMRSTFGVVPGTQGGYTFSRMLFAREFNAPSTKDQLHLVQEYSVIAS
jgi:hypothetical protein